MVELLLTGALIATSIDAIYWTARGMKAERELSRASEAIETKNRLIKSTIELLTELRPYRELRQWSARKLKPAPVTPIEHGPYFKSGTDEEGGLEG